MKMSETLGARQAPHLPITHTHTVLALPHTHIPVKMAIH